MSGSGAAGMLDSMARKGLIYRMRAGEEDFFQAIQFVVGVHEFHVDSIDREYVELAEELDEYIAGTVLQQFRVVPVKASLDATTAIAAYDRIRELIKSQDTFAVADCICRKSKHLVEEGCSKPRETCLIFGHAAQYYVDYNKGRKISVQDALDIIDTAEENALVLMPTNSKDIINVCCCCSCCCGVLKLLKKHPRPARSVYTNFQARIDPDLCSECGTCLQRCQMEAVLEDDGFMRVDLERCIGCGLCVPTCASEAVSLVTRPSDLPLPVNQAHMLAEIAAERGLGFGKLRGMMKRGSDRSLGKTLPLLYRSGLGRPLVDFMSKRGWV
jgi:Pyruvate/2-oxoacid:ferredoxin oxidoreductase delta subunit